MVINKANKINTDNYLIFDEKKILKNYEIKSIFTFLKHIDK